MAHIALIVAGVYFGLCLVTYLCLLPLLKMAKASDQALGRQRRVRAAAAPPPSHSPAAGDGGVAAAGRIELAYAALTLDRLVQHSAVLLGAEEACIVMCRRGQRRRAVVVAQAGIGAEAVGGSLPEGHAVALEALAEARPVAVPGGRFSRPVAVDDQRPAAAAPVAWHGAISGALSVRRGERASRVLRPELDLLAELGSLAGLAVERRRRRVVTDADTDAELALLLDAAVRADPYTSEHAEDVVDLARWVGGELGLDVVSAHELELAAALHDVGKMRVPGQILNAPRELTSKERDVMGMHPVWSFQIVAGVPGLEPVAPLVRAHHERWDGTGYPDGLAGSRIPLASRIVSACDAVGALTTDRPYRRGVSLEEALEEVSRCSGTQFDPDVVEVLRSGLDEAASPHLAVAR